MPTAEDFPRLFASARAGSPPAFAALVAPHRTRLLAFLRVRISAHLRRLVGAEDLLQETLMHAFRSVGDVDFDDPAAFRAWLFRIAQNVVNESGRRHMGTKKRDVRREVSLPSTAGTRVGLVASATGIASRMRREERLQRLERALQVLSPEHREVIVLSRIEGLPLSAVAERMERSPRAVSALLLRALRKLRSAFGETESLALPVRGIVLPPDGAAPGDTP